MEEKMTKIRYNLKASQDRRKRYVDKNIFFRYFKVGEHVFLKMKAKRSSLILGYCPKLAVRHCGIFEILEKIRPVAYMIALLTSTILNNLFHVSLFNKYVFESNHISDWTMIQVEKEGDFQMELVRILYQKVNVLRNKVIMLVKVQWTCYSPKDATWEHEETMHEEYP
jgi:hypothetical protein